MVDNVSNACGVYDMQEKLVSEKTEEFLDTIKYNGNERQYIKELIVALVIAVIKDNMKKKTNSVYRILGYYLKKSRNTIVLESKEAMHEMLSNEETIRIIADYGLEGKITLTQFLKLALVVVERQVKYEQDRKGTWIG